MACFYQISLLPIRPAQKRTQQGFSEPGASAGGWPGHKPRPDPLPLPAQAARSNFTTPATPGYPTRAGQVGRLRGQYVRILTGRSVLLAHLTSPRKRGRGKGGGDFREKEQPLPLDKTLVHRDPLKGSEPGAPPPQVPDPTDSLRKWPRSHSKAFLLQESEPLYCPPPLRYPYSPSPPDSSLLRDPLYPHALLPARSHSPPHSRDSRVPSPSEGSDGLSNARPRPAALPGGHRLYPDQSASGKPRPRRSCRTTWRRPDSCTIVARFTEV